MSVGADVGPARAAGGRPTWERLAECPRCIAYGPNLTRTVATALIVGTVLFLINHLDAVLHGQAGTGAWIATAVSFAVPFCVSNAGLLVASRRVRPALPEGVEIGKPLPGAAPTWVRLRECPRCVLYPRHLMRTAATALVVGTAYFLINQLGTVLGGHATVGVWVASGVTYLVPFSVANIGLLVGCRRES